MKLLLIALGLASLVGGCAIQVPTSELPMLKLMSNPDPETPKK